MLEVIFKSANTISTTQATELLPEAQVLKDDNKKEFTTSGEVRLEFHIVHIVALCITPLSITFCFKTLNNNYTQCTSVSGVPIEEEC